MTYTAKMLMSGDLKISEDGKLAGDLVFSASSDISAQEMLDMINNPSYAPLNLGVENAGDEDGTYVRVYPGDRLVCGIIGGDAETCISLGKALIKQIEGTE